MDHIERWLFVCQSPFMGHCLTHGGMINCLFLTPGPHTLRKWKTGPRALTDLASFWICSSCISMRVLTLRQGFPESYLSGLGIWWGLTCLRTLGLPLTALSGQFIDEIASSGWCYLCQIYYCDQWTEDLFMAKALDTGVLWRLLIKVSRNYN